MKWRVFSCDTCFKQTERFDESKGNPFPYGDGWLYLFSINIKFGVGLSGVKEIRDKHFCSLKCAVDFYTLVLASSKGGVFQ